MKLSSYSTLLVFCFCSILQSQGLQTDWTIPVTITPDGITEEEAAAPKLVSDNDGNAIAAWVTEGSITVPGKLQVSHFDPATQTWSVPLDIASPTLAPIADFQLIMNPVTGEAFLAWSIGSVGIFIKRYDGAQWNTTKQIPPSGITLKMAIDTNSNLTLIWLESNPFPQKNLLKATYYNSSIPWASWTPFVKTIAEKGDFADDPGQEIKMDDAGDVFFVWSKSDGPNPSLQASWYDVARDGTWQAWVPVVKELESQIQSPPTRIPIDLNLNGIGVVTWTSGIFPNNFIKAARYDRSTTAWANWVPANETVTMPKNLTSVDCSKVAIDSSGNIFVVWKEFPLQIRASRFEPPQTWSTWAPLVKIITDDTPQICILELKMDLLGNVFLAWESSSRLDLYGLRYDQTPWVAWNPVGKSSLLTKLAFASGNLNIVTDGSGNARVYWQTSIRENLRFYGLFQSVPYDVSTDTWMPSRDLSEPLWGGLNYPSIAMNESGATIAIWLLGKDPDGNTGLRSAWAIDLASKQFADDIPTEGVDFAADSDGDANVYLLSAGTQEAESSAQLYLNLREDPIEVWTRVWQSDQQDVTQVDVAADVSGNVALDFVNDPAGNGVLYGRYGSASAVVISDPSHDARDGRVAICDLDRAASCYVANTVVRSSRSNGQEFVGEIWVNLYDPAGWQVPTLVSASGAQASSPRITMDSVANVTVVWKVLEGGKWRIQTRRLFFNINTNTWSLQDLKYLSDQSLNADMPGAAAASDSSVLFAWKLIDNDQSKIQATRYEPSDLYTWNTWDPTVPLTDLTSLAEVDQPAVSVDSAANGLVVWKIVDLSDNWRIQSARFDAQTGEWSLPSTMMRALPQYLSPAGQDADLPSVRLGEQGYGIVGYTVDRMQGNQQVIINTYNPDVREFSASADPGLQPGIFSKLATVVNYDDRVGVIARGTPTSLLRRSNGDQSVGAALLKPRSSLVPAAPVNVRGNQELHRFPLQADLMNVLRWEAGDNTATRFEIYTDAGRMQLVGIIPANYPLVFYQHCIKPGITSMYYIFAVNDAGYSNPAVITI